MKFKRIIIIFLLLISVVAIIMTGNFIHKKNIENGNIKSAKTIKVENYLCEKYHEENDAFKLIEYKPSETYYYDGGLPWKIKGWKGDRWIYEYNGVRFNVNFHSNSGDKSYNGLIFDDYQLQDVFNWSVEYLQSNIDERIIGVQTTTSSLTTYQYSLISKGTKTSDLALKKEDIKDYLNGDSEYHSIDVLIDKNNPLYEIESHNGLSIDNIDHIGDKIEEKLPNMSYSFDCEDPTSKIEFLRSGTYEMYDYNCSEMCKIYNN